MVRATATVITPTAAKIRLTVLGCKLLKAFVAAADTEDTVAVVGNKSRKGFFAAVAVAVAPVAALEEAEGAALIYIMLSL
jgi:hypothetical protein